MPFKAVKCEKKLVVCRRRGRVEMVLPCSDSCGVGRCFCRLDGKKCGVVVLPARLLYGCSFVAGVKCPFKSKEYERLLDQCETCETYLRFSRAMEEEDGKEDVEMLEYYARQRDPSFKCFCDGGACYAEYQGYCFSKTEDGALDWVCSRFDVARLADGSAVKDAFMRARAGVGV